MHLTRKQLQRFALMRKANQRAIFRAENDVLTGRTGVIFEKKPDAQILAEHAESVLVVEMLTRRTQGRKGTRTTSVRERPMHYTKNTKTENRGRFQTLHYNDRPNFRYKSSRRYFPYNPPFGSMIMTTDAGLMRPGELWS